MKNILNWKQRVFVLALSAGIFFGKVGFCRVDSLPMPSFTMDRIVDSMPSLNCAHYGVVGEFTDDFCPRYIAIDNGDTIYPMGINEVLYSGDWVMLDYEILNIEEYCTHGPAALVTCFSKIPQSECHAYFEIIPGIITPGGTYESYYFVDSSAGNVIHRTWMVDGDTLNSSERCIPNYLFTESGTHTICLEIITMEGCSSRYCDNLYVGERPSCQTEFTWHQIYPIYVQADSEIFAPWPMYHFEFVDVSDGQVVSRTWEYNGDTLSTDSCMYYTFNEPGNYTICLTSETANGCISTRCHNIVINDSSTCYAHFNYIPAMDSCWGVTNHLHGYRGGIQFFDGSSADVTSWSWDFGDGSSSNRENPYHEYPHGGLYDVCLTIETSGGCVNSYCSLVTIDTVINECMADFKYCTYRSAQGDSIAGTVIGFVNTSLPDFASAAWSFGDGSISSERNPVHRYEVPGIYKVCLTISTTDCFQNICKEVYAGVDSCSVDFTHDVLIPRCYDPDYELVHQFTAPLQEDIVSYSWSLGDGTYSSEDEVLHIFPYEGDYEVCLTVEFSNSCRATRCKTISNGYIDSIYYTKCANYLNDGIGNYTDEVLVFPVPARDEVFLKFYSVDELPVTVSVYSMAGQLVFSQEYHTIYPGENQIAIPLNPIEEGTYYYKMPLSDRSVTGKISVIK